MPVWKGRSWKWLGSYPAMIQSDSQWRRIVGWTQMAVQSVEGSARLPGSSWTKVGWHRFPLYPRNPSAFVFPAYSVTGRSSLWEAWGPCKYGDGLLRAAAGPLGPAVGVFKGHSSGCTSVLCRIIWLEGYQQLLKKQGYMFLDKTIALSILSIAKILACLSIVALPFHSHSCYHCPYFILFLDYQSIF